QRRQGSARPNAAARQSRLVATRSVAVFLLAALSRQSCPVAPAPRHIRSRFAVRERFRATSNRAIFEMLPAICPARVCPAAEKTVSRRQRSAEEYPVSVFEAAALQSEMCLAGNTNRSATGFPRAPAGPADWSKRLPGSPLSSFVCFQEADTRVPVARAESASAVPPAYPISRPEKACRCRPLRSFQENPALRR